MHCVLCVHCELSLVWNNIVSRSGARLSCRSAQSHGWTIDGARFSISNKLWWSRLVGRWSLILRLLRSIHGSWWNAVRFSNPEKVGSKFHQVSSPHCIIRCVSVCASTNIKTNSYNLNMFDIFHRFFQLQCDEHNGKDVCNEKMATEMGSIYSWDNNIFWTIVRNNHPVSWNLWRESNFNKLIDKFINHKQVNITVFFANKSSWQKLPLFLLPIYYEKYCNFRHFTIVKFTPTM